MRLSLAIAAALVLTAGTAHAGTPVDLRAEVVDADGQVTLGEVFDNAGSAGALVIAVRTGPTAVLDAGQVQIAAHRAGLDWANSRGLRRIIVREGSSAPAGGGGAAVSGRNVQVLTYARNINSGELVQASDLVWGPAAAAPANAPRDADSVIGMTARRPLRQGSAVAVSDVTSPQVIRANDAITVTYESGGVTLALQARALGAAALGQPVTVRNLQSNRTFEAIASGPGTALVGPDAQRLRAANPSQFALR